MLIIRDRPPLSNCEVARKIVGIVTGIIIFFLASCEASETATKEAPTASGMYN